jgi:hypothetical protein
MAYVTAEQLLDHLSLTEGQAALDGTLLEQKLAAAQNHVERLLGFRFTDQFLDPEAEIDPEDERADFPAGLSEAVLQLAAWWFLNRETAGPVASEAPFGVRELVAEYREYTF